MKFKFGKKQIILTAVAVLLIAIMIAVNIVLYIYSPMLHTLMAPPTESPSDTGGAHDDEQPYGYAERISEEAEEDGLVLLKNDTVDGQPYLPRPASTQFSIFGWGATDQGFLLSGGGSGGTNTNADTERRQRTTLLQAFAEGGIEYFDQLTNAYSDFSDFDSDYRTGAGGATGKNDAWKAAQNPGANWYQEHAGVINEARDYSSDAIAVLSRWGNENGGNGELKDIGSYSNGTMLELTAEEKVMLQTLQDKGFNVTVLLNTTNPIEMGFLDDYDCIKAVMYIGAPGQAGAKAIPNLLVGSKLVDGETVQLSPSGRLSDTLANDWNDWHIAPSYLNVGFTDNIAYTEGIYVGYKWYETADVEGYFDQFGGYDKVVRYPFGYGLSYTTFTQEIESFTCDGKKVDDGAAIVEGGNYTMTVKVTNTGDYPAKDVVQLYYTPEYHDGGIEKASVNLLAFAKTGVIESGESQIVTLTFSDYELASYDDYDKNGNGFKGYEVDAGTYEIKLMQNAHEEIAGQAVSLHTDGIRIEKDPFTGNEVKNLFTGDDAYANMPVDGSKGVTGGVTYLSRKRGTDGKGFANYNDAVKKVSTANGEAGNARSFDYKGYDSDEEIQNEVANYEYGSDLGIYLTTVGENNDKPTAEDLSGETDALLKIDQDLARSLIAENDVDLWDMLLNEITQSEIANLIWMQGGKFGAEMIESVAKPSTRDKDGPSGFNDNTTASNPVDYPFYPIEAMLGCTWNIDMMREIGRAQGMVGVQEKLQGWYAPGVNLHRSPYNSRNYEYFSEDGVLSGWLAAGIINGAKEEGVYCYLKHFALAESGQNSSGQTGWSEWTTEQNLRENYCKPFEIAVKVSIDPSTGKLAKNVKVRYDSETETLVADPEGRCQTGANAIMSAFNCIGGIWSGYNHALLTDMLRTEWGFRGTVVTDYWQGYMSDFARGLKAGNNIWMTTSVQNISLDFNNVGVAYAARKAAESVLYTYVDTVYTSGIEVAAAAAKPFSPLFVTLWVLIDVALGLGIAACVLFCFWSPKKKTASPDASPDDLMAGPEAQPEVPDTPSEE